MNPPEKYASTEAANMNANDAVADRTRRGNHGATPTASAAATIPTPAIDSTSGISGSVAPVTDSVPENRPIANRIGSWIATATRIARWRRVNDSSAMRDPSGTL